MLLDDGAAVPEGNVGRLVEFDRVVASRHVHRAVDGVNVSVEGIVLMSSFSLE